MDDLSINIPRIQGMTKPDEHDSRRNSTGKILSSNSGEKIPHYLRASTGSCHDFCKYGRKDASEVKVKCPVRGIPRRLPTKAPDSRSSVESVVLPEGKNMSVIKLNNSRDSKILLPDTCNATEQKLSRKSIDNQNSVGIELLTERKKTSLAKLKPSSYSKPLVYNAPKTMKQEVSSSPEKLEFSSKKGSIKPKEKDMSAKHVTSLKPKSLAVKELPSPDTSRGSGGRRNSDLKIVGKTGTSLKPKSLALKQMSSPEPLGGSNGQRNSDVKISKRAGTSMSALKKVLVSPIGSLSPRPSLRRVASLKAQKNRTLKVVSPLKDQNNIGKAKPKQVNYDEIQEKTLYVIKIETENKPLESDQNKNCELEPSPTSPPPSSSPKSLSLPKSFSSIEGEDQESGYTMSETEDSFSEDNEVDSIENAETLDEEDKGKPRKPGMVCSEDKDSQPLKFRRGKVVDPNFQSNSPRRLKFRRGKVLGENQNVKADARRQSFKKRVVDDGTVGTEAGPEKVVLRHQDVQGKKDAKGLYNNVIEETASKLVETRKSKVKALVGAFETVISLQESNPSANSVT